MSTGTKKLGRVQVGDRVVTPMGRVARVEAVRGEADDTCVRLLLRYLEAPATATQSHMDRFTVVLPKRMCAPYEGPPVAFADEIVVAKIKIARALMREQAGE
jgi:hypothetical protein